MSVATETRLDAAIEAATQRLLELQHPDGYWVGELTARLGEAGLLWSRVSREPAATIALRPGSEHERPGPGTKRPNVTRAGAWTGTGWPATMEGAVRSGVAAARALTATRHEVAA